jgi:structural maintenance of chromosome 2
MLICIVSRYSPDNTRAEQEYQELMEKKKIIENDKAKIEAVIRELEEKKNEALNTTWQKVNK